jgi:hypothetical protein
MIFGVSVPQSAGGALVLATPGDADPALPVGAVQS